MTATERLIEARNLGSIASVDVVKEISATLVHADNPDEPTHNRLVTVWDIVNAQLQAIQPLGQPLDSGVTLFACDDVR